MTLLKSTKITTAILAGLTLGISYTGIASPAYDYRPLTPAIGDVTVLDYIGHTVGYSLEKGGPVWWAYLRDNVSYDLMAAGEELRAKKKELEVARAKAIKFHRKGPLPTLESLVSELTWRLVGTMESEQDPRTVALFYDYKYKAVPGRPHEPAAYIAEEDPNFKGSYTRADFHNSRISKYYAGYYSRGGVAVDSTDTIYTVMEAFTPTAANAPITDEQGRSWGIIGAINPHLVAWDYGVEAGEQALYITNTAVSRVWASNKTLVSESYALVRAHQDIREARKCLIIVLAVTDEPYVFKNEDGILCPGAYLKLSYYFDFEEDETKGILSVTPFYETANEKHREELAATIAPWKGRRAKDKHISVNTYLEQIESALGVDLSLAIPKGIRGTVVWMVSDFSPSD